MSFGSLVFTILCILVSISVFPFLFPFIPLLIYSLRISRFKVFIRSIRAIRVQVKYISVFPILFDYRLPPSRLCKPQTCLVLLSLLRRFRFFCCEYNYLPQIPLIYFCHFCHLASPKAPTVGSAGNKKNKFL